MRKLLLLLVAALSLAALPAAAERAYSGGRGSPGAPPGKGVYYGQGGHGHYDHSYRGGYHGSGSYRSGGYYPWAGLALFSAIAGAAIIAESSRLPPPDPDYGGPALFIERWPEGSPYPAGNWYYCQSSALYYPYTKACPEGWQAVPPNPW